MARMTTAAAAPPPSPRDPPPLAPAPAPAPLVSLEPDTPPPGALLGDASAVLVALNTAPGISPRERQLLVEVWRRCYTDAPPPDVWCARQRHDAWLGWTRIDLPDLCAALGRWAYPSNLSTQLNKFVRLRLLARGKDDRMNWVCFRAPHRWDASLRDAEAAADRHRRAGAGQPQRVEPARPDIPLAERSDLDRTQRPKRPYLTQEALAVALEASADPALFDACWRFIHAYQTRWCLTFLVKDIKRLVRMLNEEGWTWSLLNAKDQDNHDRYRDSIVSPWPYLVRGVDEINGRDQDFAGAGTRRQNGTAKRAPSPSGAQDQQERKEPDNVHDTSALAPAAARRRREPAAAHAGAPAARGTRGHGSYADLLE